MEKIKIEDIRKSSEYRKVIEIDIGGATVEAKIIDPKGKLFDHLYEVIASLLENETYETEDKLVIDEDNLLNYMINILTNIEVGLDDVFTLDDNVGFLEVISVIQEIHSEILTKIRINLTSFYINEKQNYYGKKLEKAYMSFLDVKEQMDKEELKDNRE